MKKILIVLVFLFVLLTGIVTYLGLVPGLSSALLRPKDLGIKPNSQLAETVNERVGYVVNLQNESLPSQAEPVYTGSQTIDEAFTSEEVTAVLESWSKDWAITPFYGVQVKLHGTTGEVSGVFRLRKAIEMAQRMGYSDNQVEKARNYASFTNGDLPFYAHGDAEVNNNQLRLDLKKLQVGRVWLPAGLLKTVTSAIEQVVEQRINMTQGLSVDTLKIADDRLQLKGTIPQQVSEGR